MLILYFRVALIGFLALKGIFSIKQQEMQFEDFARIGYD